MKIHEASKILILGLIVGCHALLSLYKEKPSLRLVAMAVKLLDLNKPCSCKYGRKLKRTKKNDIYDFLVQYCTQEQNCSQYFSSIVQQCKWPSILRSNAEIQKFCYHGNVTSHYSPLHSLKTWITREQNMQVSR